MPGVVRRGRVVGLIGVVAGIAAAGVVAGGVRDGAIVGESAERLDRHPRTFTIAATGDWLPENRLNAAAAAAATAVGAGARYDHRPLLAPVTPIIAAADLSICHMETPIGAPGDIAGFRGRSSLGSSLIAAPYEVAHDLARVGFDRCSTASNHSYDLGVEGIASTLTALDAAGISHVGTARTPAEAAVDVFAVEGVRVSHLAVARNSNTGWPSDDWRIDRLRDVDEVVDDIARARAAGADVVVVSVHVFVEMQTAPTPEDRSIVTEIIDRSDVDLVLVHGPHVVQPMEVVRSTPVFWSLGNFVSGMGTPGRGRYSDPRTLDGMLATARFTERGDGRFDVEAVPVLLCQMADSRVVHRGLVPVGAAGHDDRSGIDACVARSAAVVDGLR